MKILAKVPYGSRLYGFAGPTSDIDTKYITIPSLKDMMWGQGARNKVSKIDQDDDEYIPLHRLLYDFHMGIAYAYEIVYFLANSRRHRSELDFPDSDQFEIYDEWVVDVCIDANDTHEGLLTGSCKHMVNYALGQATRYGMKGAKLKAILNMKELVSFYVDRYRNNTPPGTFLVTTPLMAFINSMEKDHPFDKVMNVTEDLSEDVKEFLHELQSDKQAYMNMHRVTNHGKKFVQVFDKEYHQDITLSEFIQRLEAMERKYGGRVTASVINGYQDRKALHHTLRIALEALIIRVHYFYDKNFYEDHQDAKDANPEKWAHHVKMQNYVSRELLGIDEIDYGLRFPLRRKDTENDPLIKEIYDIKYAKSYFLNGEEARDKIIAQVEEIIEMLEKSEALEPSIESLEPDVLKDRIFDTMKHAIKQSIIEE